MERRKNLREALFWAAPRIVVASARTRESRDAVHLQEPRIGASLVAAVGPEDEPRFYLATAKHVIEHADDGSILFVRSKSESDENGRVAEFRRKRFFDEIWYSPKDLTLDVAITPLSVGEIRDALGIATVNVLPLTFLLNPFIDADLAYTHNFEELLFVGYPEGVWDPNSGFPIVRRGVTATPLKSDYGGQPAFLIDGPVYEGCSGGPVVVAERELIAPLQEPNQSWGRRIRLANRFAFLGMITDVIPDPKTKEQRLNLGRVVKSHVIFSAIDEYELLTSRPA